MYPRKGTIAVGSDADILVWDPEKANIPSARQTHHMRVDYNCYEGMVVKGVPAQVYQRGNGSWWMAISGWGAMAPGQFIERAPWGAGAVGRSQAFESRNVPAASPVTRPVAYMPSMYFASLSRQMFGLRLIRIELRYDVSYRDNGGVQMIMVLQERVLRR